MQWHQRTQFSRCEKFTTEDNINALVTQAAAATLDDSNGVDDSVQRNANDRQEFLNQAMAPAAQAYRLAC